jgi:hypothetical protein
VSAQPTGASHRIRRRAVHITMARLQAIGVPGSRMSPVTPELCLYPWRRSYTWAWHAQHALSVAEKAGARQVAIAPKTLAFGTFKKWGYRPLSKFMGLPNSINHGRYRCVSSIFKQRVRSIQDVL